MKNKYSSIKERVVVFAVVSNIFIKTIAITKFEDVFEFRNRDSVQIDPLTHSYCYISVLVCSMLKFPVLIPSHHAC